MKKTLFTGLLVISSWLLLFSQQQIPNGNFENWTGGEPDSWNSISTVNQTTDAFQGSYAANLSSVSILGQFIPGLVTLGNVDVANQTLTGGTPYADRPDGVSFFFKYLPSGVDTMFFFAYLTRWNDITLLADTIGMTGYMNSDTYNIYTRIDLPFIYNSTEIPDTLNIIFLSSGFSGNSGSSLLIDSLIMKNGTIVSPTYCFSADEITANSFKAHWLAVPNATSYSLDVSESADFHTFLSGYENLNTGLDTFYTVNVTGTGTYYYRVRVNYDTETSINSNTVEVIAQSNYVNNNFDNVTVYSVNRNIILESGSNDIKKAVIYDMSGRLVAEIVCLSGNCSVGIQKTGIYIVEIHIQNKILRRKVILK